MNFFRFAALTVLLLSSLLAFARPWTPDDDVISGIPVDGAVRMDIQKMGIGRYHFRFIDPNVKMESVEFNKRNWSLVTIEGETRLWETGKPALPSISRAIRLANTGNAKVVVTPGKYTDYQNVDVLPQQPTDLKPENNHLVPADFAFDSSQYTTDSFFPSDIAELSEPAILRDARVALLATHPVQYNPVTKVLRVYQSIDVDVIPEAGIGINELLDTRSHAVPSFAGIYSEIIGCDDLETDALNAAPGLILIICRPNEVSVLQSFADWKTQSGRPTQIISTSLTSGQTIKDSIIMPAYTASNPPLETVIIVGEGGPNNTDYYMPVISNQSDHPYSQLVGGDILADIWVGRFSCLSASVLQTIINRSMNYERSPVMSDTTWFTYGWGYAGTDMDIITNPPNIQFCLQCMRARGVINTQYDTHYGLVNDAVINSRLANGAMFWAHRAAWIGEIVPADVQGINNSNKPFVSLNITCESGTWYGQNNTGMQEALTQLGTPTSPKGALASVSTQTSNTNPAHNNVMSAGTFYALGYLNARQPGPMYFQGKFQLWRNYYPWEASDGTGAPGFIKWNNAMGDIAVNFYTGVPRYINSNAPATVGIGQNRLELQVLQGTTPVVGALVTAWKKNAGGVTETYSREVSDDSGRVVMTLTNATAGSMFLTIIGNQVGQNLYPLIDTIQVAQTTTDLAFSTSTILDDSTGGRIGNGDGNANPGETLDLSVQIMNRGTSTATGISGTLVSNDSRITITNATQTFNADTTGHTVGSNAPFRIQLLSGLADNETFPLALTLTTNQGVRTITVPLQVRSMKLAYISSVTTPATFNPGSGADLSVTVKNIGGMATSATNARLFSLSQFITVTTPGAVFTGLPLGTNVSNPTNQLFHIQSHARTLPGTIANLGLEFYTGAVHDTIYFTVTVGTRAGTDPTGPDTYGYFAYDNTDTAYFYYPTYNWVELINGGLGTRLGLNDNVISANSASSDTSLVIRLPFTVQYYGLSYDSATLCSNGWLAFGAQPLYNNSRNWHLPAFEGPRNMVAVNWCDQTSATLPQGVYTYNDVTNHRYVITWKTTTLYTSATGTEEYQLIIYDPIYYRTPTGDASLKFQYKTFNPEPYSGGETGVSYATVGIADNTYTRGLEYCYWNTYTTGSATIPTGTPVVNQRAILFTTSQRFITGTLVGTVHSTATGLPIRNATVSVQTGNTATTDSLGHYLISEVQIGSWALSAAANGYNITGDSVTIVENDTATVNFSLTAPQMRISVNDTTMRPNDSLYASLLDTGQISDQRIIVRNTGNGTLNWSSQLIYGGSFDELDSLWEEVFSFNASQACGGDQNILGVEFDGAYFWVTGANNYNRPYHLYKLDHSGNLLRTFNCPDSAATFGWRDLAWDGHYLYGSYTNAIDKIDTATGTVVQHYPISVSPGRAIAVDTATGILYYADQASLIYKLRLSDGVALGSLPNPGGLYGLAWYPADPDSMKLYAFCRDSANFATGTRIFKINAATGANLRGPTLGIPGEKADGLAITSRWNPLIWAAMGVFENNLGADRIGLYELAFNSNWISFTPRTAILNPGQSDTVFVHLDSRNMPGAYTPGLSYRVGIKFTSTVSTDSTIIPVVMNVMHLEIPVNERSLVMPKTFSLEQNRPNPFNPVTQLSFSLPQVAQVTLTIHDELGREVVRLASNQKMSAGTHSVMFDGSRLSSGIYFYRLQAGAFTSTRKMVLLK